MGTIIEMLDVNGNLVRVDLCVCVAAVGDTLLDDESYFIPRSKQPARYVRVSIANDSEVPG